MATATLSPTVTTETADTRPVNQHCCGFCLDGKHDHCASAIWWDVSKQLYICPCQCNQHHTRCTRCGMRDVEVTRTTSQCVDVEACDTHLEILRSQNPSYQAVLRAREHLASKSTSPRPVVAPSTKQKATTGGQCLCCGESTRGGSFLPGHDARYVSAQADLFASADPAQREEILDRLEAELSPRLMHKWVTRIERLIPAPTAKVYDEEAE